MSDIQLPTKEDLQRLYERRGKEAVMEYAYRNALRALPWLAKADLTEVWPKDTVKHCYAVCRILILLKNANFNREVARTIAHDAQKAYDSANANKVATHAIGIISCVANVIQLTKAVDDAKANKDKAYADRDEIHTERNKRTKPDFIGPPETFLEACTALSDITYIPEPSHFIKYEIAIREADAIFIGAAGRVASELTKIVDVASAANVDKAMIDFKRLNQGKKLSSSIWYHNKPNEVVILENNFTEQLGNLDLGFLATDIQCLWGGISLVNPVENYAKVYSETVTEDAESLRLVIVEGVDTEKLTATRVLLLGAGGAGKTTLADRLNNREITECYEPKPATIGIDYQGHKALDLQEIGVSQAIQKNLQLYLWDFGGQSIFHGLHNAFLHENCVYVVVVDSRHEQAPDEWLQQINNLTRENKPPVLIVVNVYEECNIRQNEVRLLREFPDLLQKESFHYFACNNPNQDAFKKFVHRLVAVALINRHTVFSGMVAVKEEIKKKFEHQIFITQDKLISHINSINEERFSTNRDKKKLMEDLQSLGFVILLEDAGNEYCLKPEWTVNNAYFLLHRLRENNSKGLADMERIKQMMKDEDKQHAENLKKFLKDRELCHLVSPKHEEKQYFFPDAAPTDEPSKVRTILDETNKIRFRFDLLYMPLGLHAKLVSAFFSSQNLYIQHSQDVWREGFIVSNESKTIQAAISYNYRKSYINFTYTGDIHKATKLFKRLYNKILDCFNQQDTVIVSSILSNDDKLVYNLNLDEFLDFMKHVDGYDNFTNEVKLRRYIVNLFSIVTKSNQSTGDNTNNAIHNGTGNIEQKRDDYSTNTPPKSGGVLEKFLSLWGGVKKLFSSETKK